MICVALETDRQTPEERRSIVKVGLLQDIVRFDIGSEFTSEGVDRAVDIILKKEPLRQADVNQRVRRMMRRTSPK